MICNDEFVQFGEEPDGEEDRMMNQYFSDISKLDSGAPEIPIDDAKHSDDESEERDEENDESFNDILDIAPEDLQIDYGKRGRWTYSEGAAREQRSHGTNRSYSDDERPPRENLSEIRSQTQRLIRESVVELPKYQPAQFRSLSEFKQALKAEPIPVMALPAVISSPDNDKARLKVPKLSGQEQGYHRNYLHSLLDDEAESVDENDSELSDEDEQPSKPIASFVRNKSETDIFLDSLDPQTLNTTPYELLYSQKRPPSTMPTLTQSMLLDSQTVILDATSSCDEQKESQTQTVILDATSTCDSQFQLHKDRKNLFDSQTQTVILDPSPTCDSQFQLHNDRKKLFDSQLSVATEHDENTLSSHNEDQPPNSTE
ncbi:hypothetical protein Ciccas_012328, partial [Cichlidogyrus casuarinus]